MVQARLSRPEAVVALIPAYNPDRLLVGLVEALREHGFSRIIVVDDGSSPAASPAFEGVRHVSGCTLLRHERNRGKGRALKTGLAHLLECCPEAEGVVTVDADGQHEARDVMRVAETFLEDPAAFVIGSRCFTRGTPLRSRFGNLFTREVFRRATGVRLADTQSGLRCFSRAVARRLLRLAGERYEYEMNVLAECARAKLRFREVGIETLYFEGNRSSHFNPALDSMRICLLLLRSSRRSLLAETALSLTGSRPQSGHSSATSHEDGRVSGDIEGQ